MVYIYRRQEWLADLPNPNIYGDNIKIAIYGTDKTGGVTAHALEQKGIPFLVVDSDERKKGKIWRGVSIISPQELARYHPNAVVLMASYSLRAMKSKLHELGFCESQIYPCSHIIEGVNLTECGLPFTEEFLMESLEQYNGVAYQIFGNQSSRIIQRLNLMPTTKCSLKCKDCLAYAPLWLSKCDYDKSQIINLVKKPISLGYEIDIVSIQGGEPLLHPEFSDIVSSICDFDRVAQVKIITNGTLSIRSDLLTVLIKNKNKVFVRISNYGGISRKTGELKQLLSENEILFAEFIAKNWFENSAIRDLKLPDDKIAEGYLGCPNSRNTGGIFAVGDRYYPCATINVLDKMGYEYDESEFVLYDDPNFATKFEELQKRDIFFKSCRYCQKTFKENYISVPVADQLP